MITTLKPENYRKLFETLKKSGQTFQEVETKKRRYLIWNKVKYYNDPNAARLSMEDLGIMQAAKKEIIKNLKNINLPNNINRDYFIGLNKAYHYWYEYTEAAIFGDKAPHFEQHKKNIKFEGEALQIDINAAYLTAVKNRKLLSEKTYNKFFLEENDAKKREKKSKSNRHKGHKGEVYKYSKDCRLITVGSLAQDKKIFFYENGKVIKQEREYSEINTNVFFTAAADIGLLMSDLLHRFNGFFYWVDAVFLPANMEERAKEIINAAGYNCHSKKMYLKQDGGNFETIDKETGEVKNYNIPKSKTIENNLLYNSEFFAKQVLSEYKEIISKIGENEKIRENVSLLLNSYYNLDNKIDLYFLAKECEKLGLTLSDIIKIETLIIENEKDSIFQNDIIRTVIIRKIEEYNKQKPLPAPIENLENGNTIEREFYFRTV